VSGYSATPLPSRLGIRAGFALHVKNAPPDYLDLLDPLPAAVTFDPRMSSGVWSGLKLVVRKDLR
jgi:hypothetical protein